MVKEREIMKDSFIPQEISCYAGKECFVGAEAAQFFNCEPDAIRICFMPP